MKLIRNAIMLIAIVLFSTVDLNAQDKDKPSKGGIRAGWNYSGVFVDGEQLGENLNSFYVGLFQEKKIMPMLHYGYGLEYVQNGYQVTDLYKHKLHYVGIPLYLKLKLGPFFATGGTALNFKVAENYELLGASIEPTGSVNTFDLPLQAGLGFKILFITIDARYHWGMLEINDAGAKNQYLELGLAFSL